MSNDYNQTMDQTMQFSLSKDIPQTPEEVIMSVYRSMKEKGYDPINQIVGYLISGDPTYITSYNNARYLIRRLERDELLEEFVRSYVNSREEK